MKQTYKLIFVALLLIGLCVGGVQAVLIEYTYGGTWTNQPWYGIRAPDHLFDHLYGEGNMWEGYPVSPALTTLNVSSAYVGMDYGTTHTINQYSLTSVSSYEPRMAKSWWIEGSTDNSTWVILDARANVATWSGTETRSYSIANPSAYRYYKFNMSQNIALNNNPVVGEWNLFYQVLTPIASFTANTTNGITPLAVMLTDTSTNTPTSWAWGVNNVTGNNTWVPIGTSQNITPTFGVGNWSVNLTATNAAGSDISDQITYVNVSTPVPIVSFSATPTTGEDPLSVQFTDTSTNNPTSWVWGLKNVIGDNIWKDFSTSQNPAMEFNYGNYSINLTATNAAGSNTSSQKTFINVTEEAPLTPTFSISTTQGFAPLTLLFYDTTKGNPTSWNWSIYNTVPPQTFANFTTQDITYTFEAAGNFTVQLIATKNKKSYTTSQFINVYRIEDHDPVVVTNPYYVVYMWKRIA